MEVSFYGVRGSCPCSGERYQRYGGNTSCVLVRAGTDDPLILDLGTGLRALGWELDRLHRQQGRPVVATALLTHLHFDHILGMPFFGPLFEPANHLTIFGPSQGELTLEGVLGQLVQPPFFPIHMADFQGEITLHDLVDEDFAVGSAKVRSRAVSHVGHTLGYRIESDGRVLAYVPDHQMPLDGRSIDDGVLELCDGADLVLHDAQYSDEEFERKSTWGHSTAGYAVRVAAAAGARRLRFIHHDPFHADDDIDRLVADARRLPEARRLDEIAAAVEGSTIDLAAG